MRTWLLRILKYSVFGAIVYAISWFVHGSSGVALYEPNSIAHYIFTARTYEAPRDRIIPYTEFVPFDVARICLIEPGDTVRDFIRADDVAPFRSDREYYDDFYTIVLYSKKKQLAGFNFDTKLYDVTSNFKFSETENVVMYFTSGLKTTIILSE